MKAYKIRPTDDNFNSQDPAFRKARHAVIDGLKPVQAIALDSDGNGIAIIDPKEIEDIRQRVDELSKGMLKVTRSK